MLNPNHNFSKWNLQYALKQNYLKAMVSVARHKYTLSPSQYVWIGAKNAGDMPNITKVVC